MTLYEEFPILRQIQTATKRAKATTPGIGVTVKNGRYNIVDVAMHESGSSNVTTIESNIAPDQIVARLNHYTENAY